MGVSALRWIADDGVEFNSKREMLLHEMTLLDVKEIDIWLLQQEVSTKRMNEYRKLLRAWQQHIRTQELDSDVPLQNLDPLQ
jgi:hypothetical protein